MEELRIMGCKVKARKSKGERQWQQLKEWASRIVLKDSFKEKLRNLAKR
jgi:hypothetical protein